MLDQLHLEEILNKYAENEAMSQQDALRDILGDLQIVAKKNNINFHKALKDIDVTPQEQARKLAETIVYNDLDHVMSLTADGHVLIKDEFAEVKRYFDADDPELLDKLKKFYMDFLSIRCENLIKHYQELSKKTHYVICTENASKLAATEELARKIAKEFINEKSLTIGADVTDLADVEIFRITKEKLL